MFHTTSTNHYHQLIRREYGLSTSLHQNRVVKKNISQGNCSKTIFNQHSEEIINLTTKDHFVATAGADGKVILWNLETRKIEWIRDYDLSSCLSFGVFKIAGNSLILSSIMMDRGRSIKILDLEKGIETKTMKIPDLNPSKICVVGERIFAAIAEYSPDMGLIRDYGLREWSLQGEILRTFIHPKPAGAFPIFIGSSDFVVDIVNFRTIYVHQLKKNATVECPPTPYAIKCAHIHQKRLFCGIRSESNEPNVSIFDMETFQNMQLSFSMATLTGLRERVNSCVKSILVHNDDVYLGFENGRVLVYFLDKQRLHTLGMHCSLVNSLALKGNLLMSSSAGILRNDQVIKPGEVYFWDVRTLKNARGSIICDAPYLLNVCFVDHRVLASNQGSLIIWDYLVAHQGEQFTEESPTTITTTPQASPTQ